MTDADTGSGASLAGPWHRVLAGDKDAYGALLSRTCPSSSPPRLADCATAARWAICDPRT